MDNLLRGDHDEALTSRNGIMFKRAVFLDLNGTPRSRYAGGKPNTMLYERAAGYYAWAKQSACGGLMWTWSRGNSTFDALFNEYAARFGSWSRNLNGAVALSFYPMSLRMS